MFENQRANCHCLYSSAYRGEKQPASPLANFAWTSYHFGPTSFVCVETIFLLKLSASFIKHPVGHMQVFQLTEKIYMPPQTMGRYICPKICCQFNKHTLREYDKSEVKTVVQGSIERENHNRVENCLWGGWNLFLSKNLLGELECNV